MFNRAELATMSYPLRRSVLAACLMLAALSPVHAVDAARLADARAVFLKAVQGDGAAVKPASGKFQALHDAEPDDIVVRAYLGSCLALQGREALMPWNKLKLTESGLAQLDKALAQITPAHDAGVADGFPASLEVRLVAASTFIDLPDLFRRFDAGKRVLIEAMQHPAFASIPPDAASRFHFQAAKVARKEGRKPDERASLEKTLALDPESPDAAAARKRLQELGA
jgi:hypothetical protein